jgi:hydrogenase expression/formation protein HypC
MCLGVPGKITERYERDGLPMGRVDFGGATREVCLVYVPEARVGDYAIIHVGFALNLLDEAEARETLDLLRQVGAFDEELGPAMLEVQRDEVR